MENAFKIIGKWAALMGLAAVPTVVNAQIIQYVWVNYPGGAYQATGTITLQNVAGQWTETSYNFDVNGIDDTSLNPPDPFDFSDNVTLSTPNDNFMAIVMDSSDTNSTGATGTWNTNGLSVSYATMLSTTEIPLDQLNESLTGFGPSNAAVGYWEAVPEPSTIISGVLLLAPLAAGIVGMLRNSRKNVVRVVEHTADASRRQRPG